MNLYDIFEKLENNANTENAKQMASYMRNQFTFLGLKTPESRMITTPYFKNEKDSKEIDWEIPLNISVFFILAIFLASLVLFFMNFQRKKEMI